MSDLLKRLDAMKATERKSAAIAAYDDALDHPDCTDWQTIAHALRRAIGNVRKITTAESCADLPGGAGYAPWFAIKRRPSNGSGRDFGNVRAEITFADGRTIRAYALTYKGSAPDIAGACRAACDLWRYKTQPAGYEWRASVPAIVRAYIPESNSEYDPEIASEYTAEKRQPEPEACPNLYEIRKAMKRRIDWFDCAPLWLNIHREANQERLESVWPPISEEIAAEPEATPEPMPEAKRAPVAAQSPLVRKLLASALSGPMGWPAIKPCAILARPAPFILARAA